MVPCEGPRPHLATNGHPSRAMAALPAVSPRVTLRGWMARCPRHKIVSKCDSLIPFAWYGSSHPSSGLKHQLRCVAGWIGARIEDVGVGHVSAVPGSGVRNRDSQKKMIWFLKLAGTYDNVLTIPT